MKADLTELRGAELNFLAVRLEEMRARGLACYRCDHTFTMPGEACPEHGVTRPPEMREDWRG